MLHHGFKEILIKRLNVRQLTIVLLFVGFAVSACWDAPETYPVVPQVSFKRYTIKDSVDILDNKVKLARLTFVVKDGDGDIGLRDDDTSGIRHPDSLHFNNLFIKIFEKKNGVFEEIELSIPHNFRTPYYQTEGQNKALKADIEVKFDYPENYFQYDTVMYEFYLYDRELHKSNTGTTGELVIDELLTE